MVMYRIGILHIAFSNDHTDLSKKEYCTLSVVHPLTYCLKIVKMMMTVANSFSCLRDQQKTLHLNFLTAQFQCHSRGRSDLFLDKAS